MKASELREKSVDELQESLVSLVKDQFSYRMQKSTGQLNQTHLLKEVAKDIARVKTVLSAKEALSQKEALSAKTEETASSQVAPEQAASEEGTD